MRLTTSCKFSQMIGHESFEYKKFVRDFHFLLKTFPPYQCSMSILSFTCQRDHRGPGPKAWWLGMLALAFVTRTKNLPRDRDREILYFLRWQTPIARLGDGWMDDEEVDSDIVPFGSLHLITGARQATCPGTGNNAPDRRIPGSVSRR